MNLPPSTGPGPDLDPNREIINLDGEGLGVTIGQYDTNRHQRALDAFPTLCHAPFAVIDLGPQGQVMPCNHFNRFIGNLHDNNWLDIFRGEDWSNLRRNMANYCLSELDCRHCARQIRSGSSQSSFAQQHFDQFGSKSAQGEDPTIIIFRLSSVCNLKCVMCNGTLSHRIRKEVEKLPPIDPPPYDDRFFSEMERVLPNVEYVEFYGGEPFLIKEHLRILEILEKTGAKTSIYANTNGTSLTEKVKGFIERLNFTFIAVSVDAVTEVIHTRQRVGIDHQRCMDTLDWLLELRKRKNITIAINTTETRFNWYHLPEVFRFAIEKKIHVHINTCLYPSDTTIYDLPLGEMEYISDYFDRARKTLSSLKRLDSDVSYSHMQAMVRDEIIERRAGTKRPVPYPTEREPIYGGLMSVPELKSAPFHKPKAALAELKHTDRFDIPDFRSRLIAAWQETLADEPRGSSWEPVARELAKRASKPGQA